MSSLYMPTAELTAWAKRVGYTVTLSDEASATIFWSDPGGEIRYFCRADDHKWTRLTRSTRDQAENLVLKAASTALVEHYLIARFGNEVRGSLGLGVLRVPWGADHVAEGYALSEMDDAGCRTLLERGSAIAKAPEPMLSMLTLVPLSHYLRLSAADLITSYTDPDGAPLLIDGKYA